MKTLRIARVVLLGSLLYFATAANEQGCGASDGNEAQCTVPKDCEGRTPDANCLGTWHCVQSECAWECSGAECAGDLDCASNATCVNGQCEPMPPCTQDSDCPGGRTCENGACVAKPECEEGAFRYPCKAQNEFGTCGGREACAFGKWACNARIPAAEACNNVDDDCDGTVDEGCADPAECTVDSECAYGMYCFYGEAAMAPGCCVPLDASGAGCPTDYPRCPGVCTLAAGFCFQQSDCADNETCAISDCAKPDPATGVALPDCGTGPYQCIANPVGCTADSDCKGGERCQVCTGAEGAPAESDKMAPRLQCNVCVLDAGRCWSATDCGVNQTCEDSGLCGLDPATGAAEDPAIGVPCMPQAGTCRDIAVAGCNENTVCPDGTVCSMVLSSQYCCPLGATCEMYTLPCTCTLLPDRCWTDADCGAADHCEGAWQCPPNADCDGMDTAGQCVPDATGCKAVIPGSHGSCEMVLGWIWDGQKCVLESGCGCEADCASIFETPEACQMACTPTPTECSSDTDCPEGTACVVYCGNGWCKGTCQGQEQKPPVACLLDTDCGPGAKCTPFTYCPPCTYTPPYCAMPCQLQQVCLSPCQDTWDCPQGFFCSTADGQCNPVLPD